jgi:ADP-ribosyl-[dinitrogen reductase] hydrolase
VDISLVDNPPSHLERKARLITTRDRFRGCLLGLAAGDAVGTTVEFMPPGSFAPVTDMVGRGPFRLEAGQWTDDTSMALCLAESLLECKGFDPHDQMRRYCDWHENGRWSSTGACFDIGNTTLEALNRYRRTGEPFAGPRQRHTAGNGCIMRLAPVPMFAHGQPLADALHRCAESSRTTHGAAECLDACRLLGAVLHAALSGHDRESLLVHDHDRLGLTEPALLPIAQAAYRDSPAHQIRGSGYVVRSLEAALWAFATTDSFQAAILRATNLGDDADTTAAICGQVAGAFYGAPGIPPHWLERLALREAITDLADRLHDHAWPDAS